MANIEMSSVNNNGNLVNPNPNYVVPIAQPINFPAPAVNVQVGNQGCCDRAADFASRHFNKIACGLGAAALLTIGLVLGLMVFND